MVLISCSALLEKKFPPSCTGLCYPITFSREVLWERLKRTQTSQFMSPLAKILSTKSENLTGPTNAAKSVLKSFGRKLLKASSPRRKIKMSTGQRDFCKAWPSIPTKRSIICGVKRTKSSSSTGETSRGRSVLRANRRVERTKVPRRCREATSANSRRLKVDRQDCIECNSGSDYAKLIVSYK